MKLSIFVIFAVVNACWWIKKEDPEIRPNPSIKRVTIEENAKKTTAYHNNKRPKRPGHLTSNIQTKHSFFF